MVDPSKPTFSRRVPEGDTHERAVCDSCGFVAYENPKIVVGTVVRHEGRILLCQRAINPRRGFWTLPAGFMENHETVEDAAKREAREEACAEVQLVGLLAVYSIPRISQVQVMFRGTLVDGRCAAGPESLEVALVRPEEIPWDALAFPSVHWALRQESLVDRGLAVPPFTNPPGEMGDVR